MMIKDAIGRCWKWAFREQKSLAARLKRARRIPATTTVAAKLS